MEQTQGIPMNLARRKENVDIPQTLLEQHDQRESPVQTARLGENEGQFFGDDESIIPPSEWSENSNAPLRHLGFWQIFSLIINSVVGSGIFTQPGYVLFLTRSKPIALSLWAIGGIYTAMTMLVFVEYGIALPFNGGSMVYYHGEGDFNQTEPGFDGTSTVQAMIYVIYSYQGFININCIAGEIKQVKKNLIRASSASIILITCLYMFVTTVLYVMLDYTNLVGNEGVDDATAVMMKRAFGTDTGITVALSISEFGTLLVQVYTLARVKQAIAWRRIIPFHRFFGRQSSFGSPGGALLLHGVFTSIPLLALHNSTSAVRSFATGIYSWGHQIIIMFLGLGLLRLKKCMNKTYYGHDWSFSILKRKWALYLVALLFASTNGVILVMTAIPHAPRTVPCWYWAAITAVVIAAATLYWGALRLLMIPMGSKRKTLGSIIGFEPYFNDICQHEDSANLEYHVWEAEREGAPRFVTYKISGPTKKLRDICIKTVSYFFKRRSE